MLYDLPFVPGKKMPVAKIEIGFLRPDAATIEVRDTTHLDRIFTTGFGGGTVVDFKGYTITGAVTAYVKRSGLAPHTGSSNMPARFSLPLFRIWIGGYYAEGIGAISDISVKGVTKTFTVIDIAFESHGHWQSWANVLETT